MNDEFEIINNVFDNLQNNAENKTDEIKHLMKYLANQRKEKGQTIETFEKEYEDDIRELRNLTYNLDDDIQNMVELSKIVGDWDIIDKICIEVCEALEEDLEIRNLTGVGYRLFNQIYLDIEENEDEEEDEEEEE